VSRAPSSWCATYKAAATHVLSRPRRWPAVDHRRASCSARARVCSWRGSSPRTRSAVRCYESRERACKGETEETDAEERDGQRRPCDVSQFAAGAGAAAAGEAATSEDELSARARTVLSTAPGPGGCALTAPGRAEAPRERASRVLVFVVAPAEPFVRPRPPERSAASASCHACLVAAVVCRGRGDADRGQGGLGEDRGWLQE
jgi:hypothetical protein